MSERITQSGLAALFGYVKDAAVKAGVSEADRWHLETGSKTYGRAYRIWLAHEDYERGRAILAETGKAPADWHTGHYSPLVRDYLGMTAREAYATLQTLRSAFLAVVWARES